MHYSLLHEIFELRSPVVSGSARPESSSISTFEALVWKSSTRLRGHRRWVVTGWGGVKTRVKLEIRRKSRPLLASYPEEGLDFEIWPAVPIKIYPEGDQIPLPKHGYFGGHKRTIICSFSHASLDIRAGVPLLLKLPRSPFAPSTWKLLPDQTAAWQGLEIRIQESY